ncbi:MAG TPA: hypothetical protein VGJ32_16505 [Solirubrobacteraceae bacterium]
MTTLQLAIVCVSVLTLAAIVVAGRSATGAPPAPPATASLGDRVVVHTLDQRSIRGTLDALGGGVVTLRDAAYLEDGQAHPLGGEIRVPARNVAFTQQLDA